MARYGSEKMLLSARDDLVKVLWKLDFWSVKTKLSPFFDLLSDSSQRLSNTFMMIGLLFVSFAIGNAFGGEFAYGDSRMILDLLGGTTKSWFRTYLIFVTDTTDMSV